MATAITEPEELAGRPGGLNAVQGTALTVGAVLGTGVITLPALAVERAGPASLVAWLALVILSAPLATTFAALGSRYPDGGGVASYAGRAFGPWASTAVGWTFFFAIPLGAAPAIGFAASYVADSLGGGRTTQLAVVAAVIMLVTLSNYFGITVSASAQVYVAGVLATLLVAASLAALPHAHLSRLTPFAPHGWSAVLPTIGLLIWAFAGWEAVSPLSADYARPRRDIPRATTVALVAIGVLYLGVATATVTALGAHPGRAPLADLLAVSLGPPARPITAAAALLLTMGAVNAYFAGAARLGSSLAAQGALPASLASAPHDVPRRSLLTIAGLSLATLAVMAVTGAALDTTLLAVSACFALVYVVGTAAAVRLLRGPARVTAIMALVTSAVLMATTGWHAAYPLGIAAAAWAWTRLSLHHDR